MLLNSFHLSFEVMHISNSKIFYTKVMGGTIERDLDKWCNINLYGHQITIHHNPSISPSELSNFHWGLNVPWIDFESICNRLIAVEATFIMVPQIENRGQLNERVKMVFKDPSGYILELKSYRNFASVF